MIEAHRLRNTLLGAVLDFVLHCNNQDMPMVVGGGYPKDKLFNEFRTWADNHALPVDAADIEMFRMLCQLGTLQ